MQSPVTDAFREMFQGVAPGIMRVFDFMGWAESEIEEGKRRYPRHRATIHALFGKLQPGMLSGHPEVVFRAHCRELIMRAVHKQDLTPGTDAEVLVVLSEASLKAPLDSTHTNLMEHVFLHCFPERRRELPKHRPSWSGYEQEVLETIRRRIGSRSGR